MLDRFTLADGHNTLFFDVSSAQIFILNFADSIYRCLQRRSDKMEGLMGSHTCATETDADEPFRVPDVGSQVTVPARQEVATFENHWPPEKNRIFSSSWHI